MYGPGPERQVSLSTLTLPIKMAKVGVGDGIGVSVEVGAKVSVAVMGFLVFVVETFGVPVSTFTLVVFVLVNSFTTAGEEEFPEVNLKAKISATKINTVNTPAKIFLVFISAIREVYRGQGSMASPFYYS
jgi:hypothetical protein